MAILISYPSRLTQTPGKLGLLPGEGKPGVGACGEGGGGGDGGHPPALPGESPAGGYFEPGLDDWLDDTKGLPDPAVSRPVMLTGKVRGVLHDHFGDFEGFVLEAYSGLNYQFFSTEERISDIVNHAKETRAIVTVVTTEQDSKHVRRILLS